MSQTPTEELGRPRGQGSSSGGLTPALLPKRDPQVGALASALSTLVPLLGCVWLSHGVMDLGTSKRSPASARFHAASWRC